MPHNYLMKALKAKYSIILILLYIAIQQFYAQNSKLVQFTGRLHDVEEQPLPYAHVLVLNNSKGTITDSDGKFSFVVEGLDTIMFSTIGFKRKILVIPDTLKNPFLSLDIFLETDTIMLPEVRIYPWKSYEEFKEAFLNLKLPKENMERARRNIAIIKTQIILDNSPSPNANFRQVFEEQYKETFSSYQYPSYSILNPFAWAKFFQALKRGDFKSR